MSRLRRADASFWVLTAVVILSAGLVAQLLVAPAGPATHVELVASLLILGTSAVLLIRVLRYLTGAAGRTRRRQPMLLNGRAAVARIRRRPR